MNLPWFRMYSEFLSDPLIRMLSFEDQRHFVACLCLKASGVLDKEYPTDALKRRVIASMIGLSDTAEGGKCALDEANRRLRELGLVDENWQPKNWEKRQFKSDHDAAERKQRQRERERHKEGVNDVTTMSRDSHALEQNRTEQNKGKRSRRAPAEFKPDLAYAVSQVPDIDAEAEARKFRDWEFKTPRSDWAAVWRTWISNCKDSGKYSRKASEKWQ